MNYNRTLNDDFIQLLNEGKELHWLFEYVKNSDDLDFLVGANITNKNGWISIYRGLSRILTITQTKNSILKFDADKAYKDITPDLYGSKELPNSFTNEKELLKKLHKKVSTDDRFNKHYKNKKEGYYQNILSRRYGINSTQESEFVIIDKEAVIGYDNQQQKDTVFTPLQMKFKNLQELLSNEDPKKFGKNLKKKSLGGELDFIAINQSGDILLIEYKDGSNTSGIYLSPIQIGFYTTLFTEFGEELEPSLLSMLDQKQKAGLISKDFKRPSKLKRILPILMISNHKEKSVAKEKFQDVMQIIREKSDFGTNFLENIEIVNFSEDKGLIQLDWQH